MIQKLDNTDLQVAMEIRALFQKSYAVEAVLFRVLNFPPMNRPLNEFLHCDTEFYGLRVNNKFVAIIEFRSDKNLTDIHSLVVDPGYFRKGLATKLISFVIHSFSSKAYTVETGAENKPAIKLYEKLGFLEVKRWDTEFGIQKIRLKKSRHISG